MRQPDPQLVAAVRDRRAEGNVFLQEGSIMSSMEATFSIATEHREISHHLNIIPIDGRP